MQTQSFNSQTPLFQGYPLSKRKHQEEFWVSTRTEEPVFGAETPSQMLHLSFGGDKGGEDNSKSLKANTLAFEEIPHLTLGEGDKGGTKIWEPATHKSFIIGQKRYEISNHLGNVSSVITDRKFGVPLSGTDPTISYYLADIVSATDFDPYGQGQEFDSELGEVWSAEFWEYDASLGRRWDIDPIDLPWQSPYVAFDCNPIAFSDPLGLAATGDGDGKSPEQQKQTATKEKKSNKHKNYKTNQNVVQELAKNNSPEKLDVGYQQKSKTTVGQMEYHGRKTADAIRKAQRVYRVIKTVVRVFSASNPVSALMSEAIFMVAESYVIYYFSQPVVSLVVDEKQITSDHPLRIEAIRSDPSQATNQECRDAYNKSKKGEILEPWERKLVEEYFSRIKRGLMDKDGNDILNGEIEQNIVEDEESEQKDDNSRYTNKTATEIIEKYKKGSIKEVFPGELLPKTWEEIQEGAKKGIKEYQKAKKLLGQDRFDKKDNRK